MFKSQVFLLIGIMVAAGCAKNDPPGQMSTADQMRLKSEKDKFDTNKPLTADTHFAAGQFAESNGDPDTAVAQYQAALKIDPNNLGSLLRLGMLYTAQQQYPEAIELFQRFVKATNESANAYGDLGFCLELAGRTDEAVAAYKAGIAKDPKNQSCRVKYGLLLARSGKIAEATTQLQVVLTPAQIHYNIASVLEGQGRTEQAKSEYQAALQLDPNMGDAKARLAAMPPEQITTP
jgi:tetratricopeptide (TPR) repeat protein